MTSLSIPRQLDEPRCVWAAAARLGEGTCWSVREQSLYWVDILGQRLFRFTPTSGEQRSWAFDETISAVAERSRGPGLVVTLRHSIALFEPATGALRRLQEVEPERPCNRFNDGKCDAHGRFWAGTMDFDCVAATGALYCYTPTPVRSAAARDDIGTWSRALDAGFAVTNGPTWSGDGRTMYFNDTVRGEINAYDFDGASATLTNPRRWLRFAEADGHPDGITTDAAGRIWVAHWGAGCVSCHDPADARELMRIALPTAHVSNLTFGGAALDTLYITTARSGLGADALRRQPLAGSLFAVRTDALGCAAHLFDG